MLKFATKVINNIQTLLNAFNTLENLNKAVEKLNTLLQLALFTIKKRYYLNKKGVIQQNTVYIKTNQKYKAKYKQDLNLKATSRAKKHYNHTVQKAKSTIQAKLIKEINSNIDLYKIIGQYKPKSQFQSPPLRNSKNNITKPTEKA